MTKTEKPPDPICPSCEGNRLRRETRRIPLAMGGRRYTTGGWWICLGCGNCFDGVTDRDDGVLPGWVEKRAAGGRDISMLEKKERPMDSIQLLENHDE